VNKNLCRKYVTTEKGARWNVTKCNVAKASGFGPKKSFWLICQNV